MKRHFSICAALALVVTATATAKTIVGTARADVLRGTSAADVIDGRGGADRLYGYAGADRLVGGPGNDVLYAGAGRDVIVCGRGRDTAWADASDRIAADCEVVRRPVVAAKLLRRGPLAAGTYVSSTSLPRVRLTVGAGWQVSGYGHGEEFTLTRAFTDYVALGRQGGSVDEAAERLSTVGTVTAGPAATRVGGLTGKRFDLVGPTTITTPFPGSFFLQDGDSARVWVLDRRGRTLTIVAKARTADLSAYLALAQRILDSFVFEP